ncbi:hypothetical protein SARC_02083 [Sphaeroforma arctica JP610]|uniref:Bestrophin homolog n=1 Tax=Sphaeroforma arctica JP610 TaxID=667725 RepID=A0A0L0GBW3_9EUKA|nr:hypothetical protein SARC_02083 [Sphaeroforma arctica JP610]KNC85743.1 hypothetical protein SARC_02083 [Sphaeroforma arctica JP610]|eukprot:XP_014159645.1 hypothetical protein SARC_02083 [Sphaeroforma arctica JP610]
MVVSYDAKRPAQSMLRYKGTLWEYVLFNGWFWFFLAMNLMFIAMRVTGLLHIDDAPLIPASTLAIVGSLVSFGMVIFLNTVLSRFNDQVKMMIAVGGNLFNIVSMAVCMFKGKSAEARAQQLARYGNAMNHICYYTMGNVTNWDYLIAKNILTLEETEILKTFRGKATNLLASWMFDSLEMARDEGTLKVSVREMQECIMAMRANTSMLQDVQRFPPPLGYYHFLVMTLHSWLGLLAYSTAYIPEKPEKAWIVFLPYIVVLFAYMGLSCIAYAHVDPFGEDSSDVDIIAEIDGVLRQTQQILKKSIHPALRNPPMTKNFDSEISKSHSRENTPTPGKELHHQISLPLILVYFAPKWKRLARYCKESNVSELGHIVRYRHKLPAGDKDGYDSASIIEIPDRDQSHNPVHVHEGSMNIMEHRGYDGGSMGQQIHKSA